MTTRRVFIKNGSLALLSLGFAPMFIARSAQAAQARKKVLVAIFQRGAVDGLNMIVPFGDKAYYKARPSIGIPRPNENEGAVDLDGFFGLHPRMRPLGRSVPSQRARDRARVRIAGRDAVALRRAGLHGDGDAGREGRATAG